MYQKGRQFQILMHVNLLFGIFKMWTIRNEEPV